MFQEGYMILMFDGVQLIVARIAERALSGWWSDSHISGNLYLQRGAQTQTASIDDKEDQHEFWKEPSVFTPA